jgi:AcrR family transcriptional regulator
MSTASGKHPGRPASETLRLRRQEEILEAAAKLFAKHGYAEANTQTLADTLEVGKGTIYRYFPTKQDLFLAAVDRLLGQLETAIDECMEAVDDPMEGMARAVRAYLAFFAEHPEFVELLIQERAQFNDREKPRYFARRDATAERWRTMLSGLIAQGRVRDVPVERIMDVMGDLLYGTMFTNYFISRSRSPEEQAADILDVALYGIYTDSERSRRKAESGGLSRFSCSDAQRPHGAPTEGWSGTVPLG